MNMKLKLYFSALLFCLVVAGCVEDTGNYVYEDPAEIAPLINSEMEEHYDAVMLDQLEIKVEMEGDESQYDYLWYAYPTKLAAEPVDTLGYEKDLDYKVTLEPELYTLVFKATNKTNQTAVYQKSELSVSSIFGIGYYVNKYEEGYTDVDFVDRYGDVNPNIMKTINGESLSGQPVNSAFFSVGYGYQEEDVEGNIIQYSGEPAYMVCSDNDFRIYHGETMVELANFETAFMERPEVKSPQGVVATSVGFMLMNNNHIHMLPSSTTLGKFGYPYPNRDFEYSKYLISGTNSYITFDDKSGQFLGYVASKNEAITDDTYSDYDLVYLAAQPYYLFISYYSYALLKHKTENKAYWVKIASTNVSSSVFRYTEYPVPPNVGILNATVFAIGGANPVLYYSNGDNHIRYYNFSNQTEQEVLTLPEDEKVVYIKNVFDLAYGPNIFLVLTDKGDTWNLRVYDFEGATPDLSLPAKETYSGNGTPSTVVYRNANTYVTY